jgi:hypothetical protein
MQSYAFFVVAVVDPRKLLSFRDPMTVIVDQIDTAGMPDLFAPISGIKHQEKFFFPKDVAQMLGA